MTNEELACAAKQGDREALEQLWRQVCQYAYRIVARYTEKPYAATEDYLQTAFLGVHEAVMAFDPERGGFLTLADWYIRRACNGFYHWKQGAQHECLSYDVPMNAEDPDGGDFRDSFPDESIPPPWARLHAQTTARDVRAAVEKLPERERQIIKQHYFQQLPLGEIGKAQHISGERVRMIEKRALQRLEKPLEAYRREYAPVRGVGVAAFRREGQSAVERVAIRNLDRELAAFRRSVMKSVKAGIYPQDVAQYMIANFKAQRGIV